MGDPDVSDDELKTAVMDLTPAGTSEVAEQVGLSRQAVEYRLKQFDDQWNNPVWSKKIGPTRVWLHNQQVLKPDFYDGDTLG